MVYLQSREIGGVTVFYDEKSVNARLVLDPPDTGYFNHNGHALVLFKTPARQWRRGFCSDNHEIYNPFKKFINEGVYRPGFGAMTICSIFDPKYAPDPNYARKQIASPEIHSIALSKHLMLSKSPVASRPYPLVWYDCDPIGYLRGDRFVIDDDIFQQEVEDELHRTGHEHWIS